jgi:hypothetical protein
MLKGLKSKNGNVRKYSALILGKIGNSEIMPYLNKALELEFDRSVGNSIKYAIADLSELLERERSPGGLSWLYYTFKTWRKSVYTDLGKSYPVGNDPSVKNNGKLCGLYYEVNNIGEQVTLIGIADAGADYRSSEYSLSDTGTYIPCKRLPDGKIKYLSEVKFERKPKAGYWFALMKYYYNGKKKIPYDKEYSKNHYAIVIFPSEYGISGKGTYIFNEEGILYKRDLGDTTYVDTFPGPDPVQHGWEIAQ